MAFGSCGFSSAILVLLVASARGDTAKEQDVSCASNTAHASLLQKATQHHEKSGLVQEPPQCPVCAAGQECYCTRESCTCIMQGLLGSSTPTLAVDPPRLPPATQPAVSSAPCGATAQGRCWYLSEMGETCAATCAKYGRSFSFVLADPARPVIPTLVNHEPQTKQEVWAALECYSPGEDRYHPANANAAKHHTNDEMGAWSHEECKLSCPCGDQLGSLSSAPAVNAQCSWIPPSSCAPQFLYKGVVYSGCAEVDSEHNTAWCQHSFQHITETGPGVLQDWSYCTSSCVSEPAVVPTQTACVWNPAASCVKEFDYQGTHYVGCTITDHETPWCSNTNPYQGSWNNCLNSCADTTSPIKDDDLVCMWQPKQECSKSFKYKGVDYTGCATVDHPTPWCSHDRIHKGSWTTCTKTCSGAQGTAVTLPAEPEDACTRYPERMTQFKNDAIGLSAPLDEAGYLTTASAESPLNMKRFICRVVDKIGCRVTDVSSLMAFVPSYSGLVSRKAYVGLEAELAALCHAGGQWVVFKEPAGEKWVDAPQ